MYFFVLYLLEYTEDYCSKVTDWEKVYWILILLQDPVSSGH